MSKKNRTADIYISQKTAIEKYGVTKKIIEQYFPKPMVKYNGRYRYSRLWKQQDVESAVSQPAVKQLIKRDLLHVEIAVIIEHAAVIDYIRYDQHRRRSKAKQKGY